MYQHLGKLLGLSAQSVSITKADNRNDIMFPETKNN